MRFYLLFTNEGSLYIAYNETSFTAQTLILFTMLHFCEGEKKTNNKSFYLALDSISNLAGNKLLKKQSRFDVK